MATKGVKTVKVNLNPMIKKAMHQPRTNSGYALYTHTKNYTDDGKSEDAFERGALSDPEYNSKKEHTYNSPKNIRRLFITGDKVYIQYYTSFFNKGKQDVGTWVSKPLKNSEGKTLFEMADEIVKFTESRNQIDLYSEAGIQQEIVNYQFTEGSLFKALSNGWVLSNIEELYVDWTVLLDETSAYKLLNGNRTPYEIIKRYRGNVGNSGYGASEEIKHLIYDYNHGTNKELLDRFPRLRFVAVVQNLSEVMKHPSMDRAADRIKLGYQEFKKLWLEVNRKLIDEIGGSVLYCNFNGSLENYKTAESQYLFDSKLKIWFEKHVGDIKKSRREGTYNYSDVNNSDTTGELHPLEVQLMSYEKTMTPKQFSNLLNISTRNYSSKELKALLSEFTKENRENYAKIIGIKL